tara:strand:+ start:668 stop:1717 length:1050 start_codon:yes stop_codon:yes gene_type:complete
MAYTTIDDPSEYFTITLYAGNGSDDRSITNSANAGNFKPDWVWGKNRSQAGRHTWSDSSRGATKNIFSERTDAESTEADVLQAFETNGFQVGTDTRLNSNGDNFVAWQWKANGGTTSSNSDGTITSTVQANTTAGFSIVTYTGNNTSNATVGHGLGATPDVIIVKNRSGSNGWRFRHQKLDSGKNLYLDAADGQLNDGSRTDLTSSTVFTLTNAGAAINASSNNYVAYCFAEVKGYSKFGSYEGNNSTDGTFVYTGFKPAWVMVKNIDAAYGWQILDNKRDPHNVRNQSLFANLSNAEDVTTADETDFLSNGFKNREGGNSANDNYTYIYMAFAEYPFVSSKGVPVTAR